MAWDSSRPVPWKRLGMLLALYASRDAGRHRILEHGQDRHRLRSASLFGVVVAGTFLVILTKFGWTMPILRSRRGARGGPHRAAGSQGQVSPGVAGRVGGRPPAQARPDEAHQHRSQPAPARTRRPQALSWLAGLTSARSWGASSRSTPGRPACAAGPCSPTAGLRSPRTGSSPSTSRSRAGSSTTPPRSGRPCGDPDRGDRRASPARRSRRSASPTSARPSSPGTARPGGRSTGPSSGRTAAPPTGATSSPPAGPSPRPATTGLVLDPYFSGTKFAWLLGPGGVPIADDLALGTIDAWLLWNLTGGQRPRHRPVERQPHDAARHPHASVERRAVRPARRAHRRPARGSAVERPVRGHVRHAGRAGGHPGLRHRRRPAGRAVRPGLLRARHGEEHLRHRQLRAHERRVPPARRRPRGCSPPWPGRWPTARPPTPSRAPSSSPAPRSSGCATGWGSSTSSAEIGPLAASVPDTGGVVRRAGVHRARQPVVGPVRPRHDRGHHPGHDSRPSRPGRRRGDGVPDPRRGRGDGHAPRARRSPTCASTAAPR